jgi:hypothetical protein
MTKRFKIAAVTASSARCPAEPILQKPIQPLDFYKPIWPNCRQNITPLKKQDISDDGIIKSDLIFIEI